MRETTLRDWLRCRVRGGGEIFSIGGRFLSKLYYVYETVYARFLDVFVLNEVYEFLCI